MTRTRLTTLLLTLALALATAPATLAQDESPAPEGDAMSEDLGPFSDSSQLDAAKAAYSDYRDAMSGAGVVGESLDASTDWLREWYGEGDVDADVDEADLDVDVDEADAAAEVDEELAEADDEMAEAREEVEEEKEEAIEQATD